MKKITLLAFCLLLCSASLYAQSVGPNYCGTGANNNDGGTTAWSNPTNAQGDTTSTAATVSIASNGGTSQQLRCSNYSFSIPSTATIVGVTVEIECSSVNNNRQFWNNVRLLVGGTETGSNQSDGSQISTSKGFVTWGSSSSTWGTTLTPAQVNASGFGVSIKLVRSSSQSTTTSVFRVRITVTYTTTKSYLGFFAL